MGYKLREYGIQLRRLSWVQGAEGESKLLWPKKVRDTVTLRSWDRPYVGEVLVDKPGRHVAHSPVCPVRHKLRGDEVCRNETQVREASRTASEFVDGAQRLRQECKKYRQAGYSQLLIS